MNVVSLEIPEVKLIEPKVFVDDRGYFFESFNELEFKEKVCNTRFVQDNESKSVKNTVRGLHWQRPPFAQSKLVRVVKGAVYDVAVDIRVGSPSFGKYCGAVLSQDNHSQLFIPRGFAHGFIALSDEVIFQYKCDNLYNKESEAAILWDSVGIPWEMYISKDSPIVLSQKDGNHPSLENIDKNLLFNFDINYYE